MLRSILPAQFTRSVSRQGGLHAPELFWAAERYSIALSAHDRLGSLALSLFVFSALQPTNVWHSGILFLVWIFGLWISWPTLKRAMTSPKAYSYIRHLPRMASTVGSRITSCR
ncbi:hypothetical protein SAMN04488144_14816 [Methylobacterium sp. 190mf]|nr:hypothetical protein SAMN04488144_14816 [Methylobacterium sp. 190mf]